MRITSLIIALFMGLVSWAQETTVVHGLAPTFVGKKVKLFRFEDYISMKKELLGESIVQSDSTFRVSTELDRTSEIILEIGPSKGYMYAQPGGDYEILYPRLELEKGQRMNENVVQLIFADVPPETDINFKILDFDYRLDGFLGMTYKVLADEDWKERLDRFKKHMFSLYDTVDSRFFKDYLQYSVGLVEQIGHIRKSVQLSKLEVFNGYIANQPVKYHNPKYIELIKQFYTGTVRTAPVELEKRFYKGVLKRSDTMLLNILGESDYMRDERLRELVLILELIESYKSGEYPKKNIVDLMDTLATSAEYPEHRTIAKNVKSRLTHLEKGYPAPDFELVSTTDTLVSLEELRGKYVYLNFYEDWCSRCFAEMRIIRNLREKYGEDITFVSISLDDSLAQTKRVVDENLAFDWIFLHYGLDESIKEDYLIRDLPVYYLIDPEGNILAAPALSPSPNGSYDTIDRTFFNIQKKLHPKKETNMPRY